MLVQVGERGVVAVSVERVLARPLDEHEYLTAKFGTSYKAFYVDRPEASKKLEYAVLSGTAHSSETDTQKIRELLKDSVIDNSADLEYLKEFLGELDLGKNVAEAPVKGSRFQFAPKG